MQTRLVQYMQARKAEAHSDTQEGSSVHEPGDQIQASMIAPHRSISSSQIAQSKHIKELQLKCHNE